MREHEQCVPNCLLSMYAGSGGVTLRVDDLSLDLPRRLPIMVRAGSVLLFYVWCSCRYARDRTKFKVNEWSAGGRSGRVVGEGNHIQSMGYRINAVYLVLGGGGQGQVAMERSCLRMYIVRCA